MMQMRFYFSVCLAVGLLSGCGSSKTSCTPITAVDLANPDWKPAACSSQMVAKYGEAAFGKVNESIVKMALAGNTTTLGASFEDKLLHATPARQTEFTNHLAEFLLVAYGDPNVKYSGPDMLVAHKPLDITVAQYNAFISDIVVPALATNGVDPNDISNCFAPVVTSPSFMATVITCK